jgi:aldehyde dehydrogenase (NAD+)
MATTTAVPSLLSKLQLQDVNPGACAGPDRWIAAEGGQPLVSFNPSTGEPIATVVQATADDTGAEAR